jgi:hypothetical protein
MLLCVETEVKRRLRLELFIGVPYHKADEQTDLKVASHQKFQNYNSMEEVVGKESLQIRRSVAAIVQKRFWTQDHYTYRSA